MGAAAATGDRAAAPPALSAFVGRRHELASLQRRLTEHRLITLTGPGGVGKSRLASEAGAAASAAFADGLTFVPLAAARDHVGVLSAIAQAVGAWRHPGLDLAGAVRDSLAGKHLLLILDNFEQVLSAAPLVAELLAASPRLTVLVTSRAALELSDELVVPVAPLDVPAAATSLADLEQYDALVLFRERARQVCPDFALTEATAPLVVALCQRLDGLPLAIELAAARLQTGDLSHLLDELLRRLPDPGGAAGQRPARQQTLDAAIGWSYDLLPPAQQRRFRWLGVFAGGCSASAAAKVAGSADVELLIRQSLLGRVAGRDGERYLMLETIRAFALDRLAAAGELASARRAHAHWIAALSGSLAAASAAERGRWQRAAEEHDNIRAALAWFVEHDAAGGLDVAANLTAFWRRGGHAAEGARWLERLLAAPTDDAGLRARALHAAGVLTLDQGDLAAARQRLEAAAASTQSAVLRAWCRLSLGHLRWMEGQSAEAKALLRRSLAAFRRRGDAVGVATALLHLGDQLEIAGEHERARRCLEAGTAGFRALGDREGVGQGLHLLARQAQFRAEYAEARALVSEAVALAREDGQRWDLAWRLCTAGNLERVLGNLPSARDQLEEALTIFEAMGAQQGIGSTWHFLAKLAAAEGDDQRARGLYERRLAVVRPVSPLGASIVLGELGNLARRSGDVAGAWASWREALEVLADPTGNRWHLIWSLVCLGTLAVGDGRHELGVRLLSAAAALEPRARTILDPEDWASGVASLEAARAALGDARFAQARAEGAALTASQAIDAARAQLAP